MENKILFIIVPSSFLIDEKVFPTLGVLKVAAVAKQLDYNVDVLDVSGIKNYIDVVDNYLKNQEDILFIGLSATTPQMPLCYEIARFIKKNYSQYKIVLGGSHGTLIHTAAKLERKRGIDQGRAQKELNKIVDVFDILVCGDGELTIKKIIEMNNGVIDVDDRKSEFFLSNEQFSNLPNPDRSLIDMDSYCYFIDGKRATSIISQLGCPMHCGFCSGRSSPYLRFMRNRSICSIINEIEEIYDNYGYEGLNFFDDELNISKSMLDLMTALIDFQNKKGIDLRLRGFIKSELFDDQQSKLMYEAGFRQILIGFESGSPRILKNIKKNATIEDNTKCMKIASKWGLKVKALMSISHPGESENTVKETIDWLLDVKPDDFDITTIVPMPGAPYFDWAIKENDYWVYEDSYNKDKLYMKEVDYTKEADYYKGEPGEYISYTWTDYLNSEEVVKLRDEAEDIVRRKLNIPFNQARPGINFEASMGQLPGHILRSSK